MVVKRDQVRQVINVPNYLAQMASAEKSHRAAIEWHREQGHTVVEHTSADATIIVDEFPGPIPETVQGRTCVYEYAGFRYNIVETGRSITATPCPGQHPAANKEKHRRAAVELYREGRGK